MATKKQKAQLIDRIKHGVRKYKFGIQRYGGETVVGTITPYQYHYWKARESELTDYLMGFDRENFEKEHNLPQEARFARDWYENDDVAHTNGAPIESGNFLHIDEYDQHGEPIKDANGHYVLHEPIELDHTNRFKLGIDCVESEACVDVDHPSLVNQYYLYAYTTNKGNWTTEGMIEIDGELDLKKLKLHYSQIEGVDICHSISYGDGEPIHLEEDSTGKGQECHVREGCMDEKTMSNKLKKEIARAEAETAQLDTDTDTVEEENANEPPEKSPEAQKEWDEWEKARMEGAQAAKKKSKKKQKKIKTKKTVKGKKPTKKKKENK